MTHSITPYISVRSASRAIDFYKKAFGATEMMRLDGPGGSVGHAELKIGDATFMLADEFPDIGFFSPQHLNGSPVVLHLTAPNVDELFDRAVAAGAKVDRPVADQFYGMRSGSLIDPFGHRWMIGTVTEEISNEEIIRRNAAKIAGKK